MKKILNFGSLNIDKVYRVEEFVREGETISASDCSVFSGGKGLNQSIALAKAGAMTYHAGAIGKDGMVLLDEMRSNDVDVSLVKITDVPSGHAIIQVCDTGENCIIVFAGANGTITRQDIDETISAFSEGDYLLLQNEIGNIPYIMTRAKEQGMKIVMNPSPVTRELLGYPLEYVDMFIINESELWQLSGMGVSSIEDGLFDIAGKYPQADVLLTLGGRGSMFMNKDGRVTQEALPTKIVDTTAAGDTFTGFFLASIIKGETPAIALEIAARASAITVSRMGAAASIPHISEL